VVSGEGSGVERSGRRGGDGGDVVIWISPRSSCPVMSWRLSVLPRLGISLGLGRDGVYAGVVGFVLDW
jgi:hypothetical protein